MADAAHVFDATAATFEAEVLQASLKVPVLVDFWAEWCGPCKTLGPILEKLAAEYNGAFRLAKVDVEAEQQLAGAFQVRSIPTVMLVKDGQLVDGFPGALPEAQLRQFLQHHGIEPAPAVEDVAEVEVDAAPVDPHAEVVRLRKAAEAAPDDAALRLDLALALLAAGNAREADALIEALPANLATANAPCVPARDSGSCGRPRMHRPPRCWKRRSPAIRTTCARATCSACSTWSPGATKPVCNSSWRCCNATARSKTGCPGEP